MEHDHQKATGPVLPYHIIYKKMPLQNTQRSHAIVRVGLGLGLHRYRSHQNVVITTSFSFNTSAGIRLLNLDKVKNVLTVWKMLYISGA